MRQKKPKKGSTEDGAQIEENIEAPGPSEPHRRQRGKGKRGPEGKSTLGKRTRSKARTITEEDDDEDDDVDMDEEQPQPTQLRPPNDPLSLFAPELNDQEIPPNEGSSFQHFSFYPSSDFPSDTMYAPQPLPFQNNYNDHAQLR